MELLGQAALVTGAARGIGKAIARRFAQEGADVAIVDRDGELAGAVADELKALGRRVFVAVADVSSCAQIRNAVEAAASTFGRLDICVNNAGIAKSQPFLEVSEDDW
ncbi:MAG: SDR family NAD(P)-dependent oxidoreductase, partial [Hyphomicrobiaceae bacterium]